jgi:hypothetical protein
MCAFLIPISIHHCAPSSPFSSTRPMRCAGGGTAGDTCAALPLLLPLPLLFPLLHHAPHSAVGSALASVVRGPCRLAHGALELHAKNPKSMSGSGRRDDGKMEGRGSGRGCGRETREGRTRAPKMQRCTHFHILNPLLLLPALPRTPPPHWMAAQPICPLCPSPSRLHIPSAIASSSGALPFSSRSPLKHRQEHRP